MGLTDSQKQLIEAVSKNITAKNKVFCNRYKAILQSSLNTIELPYDLKSILCVEDVTNSFKENRYYLSDREKKVYDDIICIKKVNERLAELGIPYVNSTLLYGESGTGKTTFGRYIAYKTGLPFCYLNFTNLLNSYMGETSKNISKAFSWAISNPCVFMIDEIDCISIRRSNSGDSDSTNGEMARITITLLQEFDKFPSDVIVIAATNRKDRLDEALLRRFTVKHEVKRLNQAEREEMIIKFFDDVGYKASAKELLELAATDDTQSGLMNRMIMVLVNHFMEE